MDKVDYCIIGGGIVGLFVAKSLVERYPNKDIFILEASNYLGDQSTGRNSGVLHGGMYYPKNSLKHQFCIEGNLLWKEVADQLDIPINNCGKYIIASNDAEKIAVEKIYNQGIENKVPELRWATESEIEKISEFANVVSAIYSPFTASLDVPYAVKMLDRYITNKGAFILKNEKVLALESLDDSVIVKTNTCEFIARNVFNCAGLGAVELRKKLGLKNLDNHFVKGCYLKTTQPFYNESLIYPVPFEGQSGLGVHSVFSPDGSVLFGPDAEKVDSLDYQVNERAVENLKDAVSSTFKNIDLDKLSADYAGVRSLLMHQGKVYTDFWIKSPRDVNIKGYWECLGIASPGLTSAPAIANYIVNRSDNNEHD